MAKKNDGQITPDNFLDAYKPVSPQRRTDKVDAEAETEFPKVEETQEDNRKIRVPFYRAGKMVW